MAKVFKLLWTLLLLLWQCMIGYTQPTPSPSIPTISPTANTLSPTKMPTVIPTDDVPFNLNATYLMTSSTTESTEPVEPTALPSNPTPTPTSPTPNPVVPNTPLTTVVCNDALISQTIDDYFHAYLGTKKWLKWKENGCALFDNDYQSILNITVTVTDILLKKGCNINKLFNHTNYMELITCQQHQTTSAPTSFDGNNQSPTARPSANPVTDPTTNPTGNPTPIPSQIPTESPTLNDTYLEENVSLSTSEPQTTKPVTTVPHLNMPTMHPSNFPTPDPTFGPTSPTVRPSNEPTDVPSRPSVDPTSGPTSEPTSSAPPTVSPFYWGNFSTTSNGTMYQIQPNNADFTQSMIIMAVIIIGLCFLGAYCNRARLNFEKSEEKKQKAPTKLKRKRQGFSQLENSESRSAKSKKRGYNNYADSSDEDSNNNDDPSSPIDDTMVSQTIALDESQKKKKKQKQRQRGIKNGLMTRHRTEKTDKIKFDQLDNDDENDNEDDNEAYASDTSELNDDGMGNNQGAKRRHHKRRKHRRDRDRDRNGNRNDNGKGGAGEGDVNVDVDEDDDDFDSDGNGGVRIIPNPYAKNRKPKGLAGVLGEKFETLKSSVNQSVSKLNARKENVVVIPMGPVGASANQKQSQKQQRQRQQQRDKPKRKKKKEIRDYGRVGSGIRRKKSKQDNESSSKRKVTKQRSESSGTQSSSGDDHDGNDNNNGHGSGNGKKKDDVFKICENDNVSDDYNITDSDGSSSNSSDAAIAVRLNKFGRGIKQPITVASVTNKGKSKRKSDSKDSSNNSGVTHGNGVPKSSS